MRGVAAALVVLHHVELLNWPGSVLFAHGYLAVDFFFILSGFVIARSYEQRLARGMTLRRYAGIRLKRVYPMMALGILLGAATELVGAGDSGGLGRSLAAHLLFVPALWTAGALFPLNGVQWSLFAELAANAGHALAVRRLSVPILVGIVSASAIALIAVARAAGGLGVGWNAETFAEGLVRATFGFAAGILLCRLKQRSRSVGVRLPCPVLPVALIMVIIFASVPAMARHWWADPLIVVLAMPALVWIGADTPLQGRAATAAMLAGELSYPVYATQLPVMRAVQEGMRGAEPVLLSVGMIVAVAAVALAAWRWVDLPLRRRFHVAETPLDRRWAGSGP